MANIKQFLDGISASKKTIRDKVLEMGVQPPDEYKDAQGNHIELDVDSNLATVAAAVGNIPVQNKDITYNVTKESNGQSIGGGQFYKGTITLGFTEDHQYYNGTTPVYASSEKAEPFEAEDGKLITQFVVRPIPIYDAGTITADTLISTGDDDKTPEFSIKPTDGMVDNYGKATPHYMQEVKLKRVMLGSYDAAYNDVFNPERIDDIVIDKTDLTNPSDGSFEWSGVNQVTIPKPDAKTRDKTIDIYNRELTFDESGEIEDFVEPVDSGIILTSAFTANITELYNDLAAI